MQYLATQAVERITNLLMNYHPLQQGGKLPYFGSKTFDCLRGNSSLME
jgi:hypothetical protein